MKLQGSCKSRMFANIIAMNLFAATAMPVCMLAQGNVGLESVLGRVEPTRLSNLRCLR